jgi:hypothetical protein
LGRFDVALRARFAGRRAAMASHWSIFIKEYR